MKLNVLAVRRNIQIIIFYDSYLMINKVDLLSECPCPSNNSVLLLNTFNRSNKPMVIRPTGDYNDDLNFEYSDDTDIHNGCAATLFGEFWYFGGGDGSARGNPHLRQVCKILPIWR